MLAEITLNIPVPNFSEWTWHQYLYVYIAFVFFRHLIDAYRVRRHNACTIDSEKRYIGRDCIVLFLYNIIIRIPVWIIGNLLCGALSICTMRRIRPPISFWTNIPYWHRGFIDFFSR